jgi:hypothetical protein
LQSESTLTWPGREIVDDVTLVLVTVLVALPETVLVVPRKHEQALLILEVSALPLPHPAARVVGIAVVEVVALFSMAP